MNSSLNALDWLLIAILAYSVVRAFLRGILIETFNLGGLIAGIYLASWNYPYLAGIFMNLASGFTRVPAAVYSAIAFLSIALGIMIITGFIARSLRQTAHVLGLGLVDRVLGAAFGLARGCLIGVALMTALTAFLPQSGFISNSQLAPYFLAGVHAVSFVVPKDLQQQILNGIDQLKHTAPDWIKLPG